MVNQSNGEKDMNSDSKKWKAMIQDEQNLCKLSFLSPTEKLMSIDLIRWKLFREFLSATELLACRLVCKQWTEDATAALLRPKFERSLCVSFIYTENGTSGKNYVNKSTGRTLGEWLQSKREAKFGSFPPHFPYTNFEFLNGPLEKNEESLRFFMGVETDNDNKSHRIVSLTLSLWNGCYGIHVAPFLELLRCRAGDLKYLNLKTIDPESWKDPSSPWYWPPLGPKDFQCHFSAEAQVKEMELKFGKVQFVALEEFQETLPNTGLGFEIVRSVLNRSPNLKWTIRPRSFNLKAIWLEKKINTVHSWFYIPDCMFTNSPIFTDKSEALIFSEEQPTLKEFGIDLEGMSRPLSAQELQCVSSVLKNSQRSLEKIWDILDLLRCAGMGIQIPQLPNVTTVTQQKPPTSIPVEWLTKIHQGQDQGQGQEVNRKGETLTQNTVTIKRDLLYRTCPNVQHVIISDPRNWGAWSVRDFAYPFEFDHLDPLQSVAKVSVYFALSRSISALAGQEIASIMRLCPNVTVIQLFIPSLRPLPFPQLFRRILENFKKARTLAFHFQDRMSPIDDPDDADQDPCKWMSQMDSVVCGFSPEACQKLAKTLQLQKQTQAGLFNPSTCGEAQSSILDLKDLICLRLKVGQSLREPSLAPFFSPVSFLCGFNILAQRQNFHLECPKQLIQQHF